MRGTREKASNTGKSSQEECQQTSVSRNQEGDGVEGGIVLITVTPKLMKTRREGVERGSKRLMETLQKPDVEREGAPKGGGEIRRLDQFP